VTVLQKGESDIIAVNTEGAESRAAAAAAPRGIENLAARGRAKRSRCRADARRDEALRRTGRHPQRERRRLSGVGQVLRERRFRRQRDTRVAHADLGGGRRQHGDADDVATSVREAGKGGCHSRHVERDRRCFHGGVRIHQKLWVVVASYMAR
jgi:hypothetical protein